jgi:hypothetical protein
MDHDLNRGRMHSTIVGAIAGRSDLVRRGVASCPLRYQRRGNEYDDGQHQSVQLCVDWQRADMALSIERFRDTASRISFFYSRPPPGVLRETGIWEARGARDHCRLSLMRRLELKPGRNESSDAFQAREQAYGAMLQAHLDRTLEAVVRPAEAGGMPPGASEISRLEWSKDTTESRVL